MPRTVLMSRVSAPKCNLSDGTSSQVLGIEFESHMRDMASGSYACKLCSNSVCTRTALSVSSIGPNATPACPPWQVLVRDSFCVFRA